MLENWRNTVEPVNSVLPHEDPSEGNLANKLAEIDWVKVSDQLTLEGCILIPGLMDGSTCNALSSMFGDDSLFAKTVVMDQPDYGRGVYRYFRTPIPEMVVQLRRTIYPHVARIANHWQELLGKVDRFPDQWEAFRDECHNAGQCTSTAILLKYSAGGFNALHRDLRGSIFFPIQLAVVLSPKAVSADPEESGFRGGDFTFCDVPEEKKSRRREIAAGMGDAILFCTRDRLVSVGGAYGLQPVKHGLTRIEAGERFVLGVPFHEYR